MKTRTAYRIRSLVFIFTLAVQSVAMYAAEGTIGYLCVADKSVGFHQAANGEWEAAEFKADGKYLIKKPREQFAKNSEDETNLWVVTPVGSDAPIYGCTSDFSDVGSLGCEGFGYFLMNKKTLRFQAYYPIGYVVERKGNTPNLAIGTCSPI
jgi:hypothetical protein